MEISKSAFNYHNNSYQLTKSHGRRFQSERFAATGRQRKCKKWSQIDTSSSPLDPLTIVTEPWLGQAHDQVTLDIIRQNKLGAYGTL